MHLLLAKNAAETDTWAMIERDEVPDGRLVVVPAFRAPDTSVRPPYVRPVLPVENREHCGRINRSSEMRGKGTRYLLTALGILQYSHRLITVWATAPGKGGIFACCAHVEAHCIRLRCDSSNYSTGEPSCNSHEWYSLKVSLVIHFT